MPSIPELTVKNTKVALRWLLATIVWSLLLNNKRTHHTVLAMLSDGTAILIRSDLVRHKGDGRSR